MRKKDPLWIRAGALASSSLQRPRQQIRSAQAEARRQAQEDAQMIQGFTTALANMLGGAGGQVDQVYAGAADRQQRIAQGYALGQQLAEQQSADQSNALLERQGGARRITPGPASQVTYALGGAGPSGLLNTSGAAFAAAAHGLPGMAAGRGQQQVAQRLSEGQKEQAKLRSQMEDLMARLPGLTAEQYDKLLARAQQQQSIDIQGQYLGVAQNRLVLDTMTQIDPTTGIPYAVTATQNKNQNKQAIAARKARVGALSSAHEKTYSQAAALYKGTKVIGPNGLPAVQRLTRQQAYSNLYQRYGKPLERLAPKGARRWWLRQIDAMIQGALTYAGWPKPAKPPFSKTRPG